MDAQRVAALYRLGMISSNEIKDYACACLEAGRWSPAIDDIVSAVQPIMSEVGPALEVVLAEQGIQVPGTEEAIWVALRHYVQDIASGAIPPRAGMQRVMSDVYHPADLHERTNEYVGDSHGLERLIGAFYAHDDLEERPAEVSVEGLHGQAAIDALGRQIVELAGAWMRQHGSDEKG